jgi:hypothetical protein
LQSREIGVGYYNEVLILSWTPDGAPARLWAYDVSDWVVYPLGTLEEFVAGLPDVAPGLYAEPTPIDNDEVQAWREYLCPAPQTEDGPGIRTTAAELLGRSAFLADLHTLVVPLGPEWPGFPSLCHDLRDAMLAPAEAGNLRMYRQTGDEKETEVTGDLADDPQLARPGTGPWVMPLSYAEERRRPGRTLVTIDADDFWPDDLPDDLVEVPPPDVDLPAPTADPALTQLSLPALRILAVLADASRPIPVAWLRPPLGTDSPHLAYTLDLCRTTVLDLYQRALVRLSVLPPLAGLSAEAALADDACWSTRSAAVYIQATDTIFGAVEEIWTTGRPHTDQPEPGPGTRPVPP